MRTVSLTGEYLELFCLSFLLSSVVVYIRVYSALVSNDQIYVDSPYQFCY